MIRCVKLVEAVPAELVFALGTLHELTATCTNDANFAVGAKFGTENFV